MMSIFGASGAGELIKELSLFWLHTTSMMSMYPGF